MVKRHAPTTRHQSTSEGDAPEAESRRQARVGSGARGLPTLPSRFQIKHELGRGGAGTVYRAYDRSAGHEVALKILHGVSGDDRLQLKNEFRALSDIVHPNLVDLYELVMEEQMCFFTMELVTGTDFATYVSNLMARTSDRDAMHQRLRDTACQLALALNALHDGGKLHRDVKPWNVLVTEAGRVVLVDFGLAASRAVQAVELNDVVAGTLLYMSPEQLMGSSLTTASDWYSCGLTLYEAICGKAPSQSEVFGSAPAFKARSLRERGFDIPEDLDNLIVALLSRELSKRPEAEEILACLGTRTAIDASRSSFVVSRDAAELVGRTQELERLGRLFEESAKTSTCVVRVLGSSGIGKTSLIRSFFDSLRSRPNTLLLESKCHPHEAVVFNAIDGLIDGLATDVADCLDDSERILPAAQHAALTQVFPVLAKVLTAEQTSQPTYSDDRQKRYVAFVGLCEILNRVARRHRLVAWLDDVQWGDEDSGILLRDLLHHGDRPPMMLVMSYRAEDEASSPCLQVLRGDGDIWAATMTLPVRPLGATQSGELVDKLIGSDWKGDPQTRDELVESAAGSPFLLTEIARYLSTAAYFEDPDASVRLDDILKIRTRDLPEDSRGILEVLAVAGAALEQQVTLNAAGIASGARGIITALERLSILRTTDVKSRRIEFYHDKLREEVLGQLGDDVRARHHYAIARALLSAPVPNPLGAIDHFEAAGAVESVRRYVVTAANHALKNLAFERAARLYRRAIELEPGETPLHELHRRLGSALGSVGRGREVALSYCAAADLLRGESDAQAEELVQLQQKAAEQFLQAGHFDEGVGMLRSVLRDFGVAFPRSREQAGRTAVLLRLFAFVRGFRPARRRRPPNEFELRRFDALWAASSRLSMIDYTFSTWATARCVREALLLGEPSRMSRALAMEASFSSLFPLPVFERHTQALLKLAEEYARQSPDSDYDSTFVLGARAVITFYNGRFRESWQQADRAIAQLRERTPGREWENSPWQMWSLVGLALNGEIRELIQRLRNLREDALLREDRYMEQNTSLGPPCVAWLATDSVDEAEERASRAIAWAGSNYTTQHYLHYLTMVDYALYRDDPLAAWERTAETWALHSREGLVFLTFLRDDLLRARGRSALAASLFLHRTGRRAAPSGQTAAELRSVAEQCARKMKRHGTGYARGFGLLLESGIENGYGQRTRALRALKAAIFAFDASEMQFFREVARYCLGRLQDDGFGRAELERAERWLDGQGVVVPAKVARTLAPGLL